LISVINLPVQKYNITPTKLELSEAIKIYDIIFSDSQAAGDVICYVSEIKGSLKYLR